MPDLAQSLIKKLEDQKYALDQAAIVAATDAKGVITYVNDKFCEVSGYNREELLGKTHKIINSGYHSKEFFGDLWKTISSGNVWRGEVCNRSKTGRLYWVYTTIVPFFDEAHQVTQYLSIRYEITDLKNAQETIIAQQEKLAASSRLSAIGEMAAAITHEINNPLATILGRVEMMKSILQDETIDRQELHKIADSIEVTGQRIAKIVRSMKTMAHHSQEQEPTMKISVQSLIEDALDLCHYRFQNHGVLLQKPQVSPSLVIECRSHQIVQVLVNLLNNSFDAVQQLAEKWVRIDVIEQETQVKISITDGGRGISEETQKKMFSPFYSTKSVQYGTGLGLSISAGILRQNAGDLEYDKKSPNTCFVITLPKKHIKK